MKNLVIRRSFHWRPLATEGHWSSIVSTRKWQWWWWWQWKIVVVMINRFRFVIVNSEHQLWKIILLWQLFSSSAECCCCCCFSCELHQVVSMVSAWKRVHHYHHLSLSLSLSSVSSSCWSSRWYYHHRKQKIIRHQTTQLGGGSLERSSLEVQPQPDQSRQLVYLVCLLYWLYHQWLYGGAVQRCTIKCCLWTTTAAETAAEATARTEDERRAKRSNKKCLPERERERESNVTGSNSSSSSKGKSCSSVPTFFLSSLRLSNVLLPAVVRLYSSSFFPEVPSVMAAMKQLSTHKQAVRLTAVVYSHKCELWPKQRRLSCRSRRTDWLQRLAAAAATAAAVDWLD